MVRGPEVFTQSCKGAKQKRRETEKDIHARGERVKGPGVSREAIGNQREPKSPSQSCTFVSITDLVTRSSRSNYSALLRAIDKRTRSRGAISLGTHVDLLTFGPVFLFAHSDSDRIQERVGLVQDCDAVGIAGSPDLEAAHANRCDRVEQLVP
jgi:hypothetical protein